MAQYADFLTFPVFLFRSWITFKESLLVGLWTTENLRYDPSTGQLLDNSTWYYHVPGALDIPADLRTTFYNSGHNPNGVLGSKTTGEPSVLAGCSVLFALR